MSGETRKGKIITDQNEDSTTIIACGGGRSCSSHSAVFPKGNEARNMERDRRREMGFLDEDNVVLIFRKKM